MNGTQKSNANKGFTQQQKDHVEKMEKVVGKGAANKLGTYDEYPGGGTPLKSGQKAPNKEWVAQHRVMQPRDEDGKFTYNAVNLKDLKYGPSRGKTIPPFMKGVQITFAKKKVGATNVSGSDVYKTDINMSPEEFLKSMQEYYNGKKGFYGFQGVTDANINKKRGRRSSFEKDMLNKGQEGFAATKDTTTVDIGSYKTIEDFRNAIFGYQNKNVPTPSPKYFSKKKPNGGSGSGSKTTTGGSGSGTNPNPNPNPKNPSGSSNTPPTPSNSGNTGSTSGVGGSGNTGGTGNTQPSQNGSAFSDDDVKMASSDPQGFITKHKDKFNELSELAKSKGKGFSVGKAVALIAKHGNAAYEAIKKQLNS